MIAPSEWSGRRKIFAALGALFLLAIVLQAAERLAPREPTQAAGPAGSGTEKLEPVRPTVTRVDDRTVLIDAGVMFKSRYRYGGEEGIDEADTLYACLVELVAEEFDNNPTSSRSEMRSRMSDIQERCQPQLAIPPLPPLPPLGGEQGSQ